MEVLHENLLTMSLIALDFSYLPDVKVPGKRAPLFSTKHVWTVYSLYSTDVAKVPAALRCFILFLIIVFECAGGDDKLDGDAAVNKFSSDIY
ncbi:unnamed protein product [Brassica rapa]|uniref:Uncharacterized protein n=3 Tax=Brassica TaxID=3705 RepID=A0A8D9HI85_BRACM|nr:unnamed protein product [Brassica napus]CAF2118992.1 unnamed protein product [Brassica napus]CAG7898266.1 unnamed protein product [Brassica rapa]